MLSFGLNGKKKFFWRCDDKPLKVPHFIKKFILERKTLINIPLRKHIP